MRLRSIIRHAFLTAHHLYALSAIDTGRNQGTKDLYVEEQNRRLLIDKRLQDET